MSVRESQTEFDPNGQVTLNVIRVGTDGVVNVQWRLSADAVYDFEHPLTGTIRFEAVSQNVKQTTHLYKKSICSSCVSDISYTQFFPDCRERIGSRLRCGHVQTRS